MTLPERIEAAITEFESVARLVLAQSGVHAYYHLAAVRPARQVIRAAEVDRRYLNWAVKRTTGWRGLLSVAARDFTPDWIIRDLAARYGVDTDG